MTNNHTDLKEAVWDYCVKSAREESWSRDELYAVIDSCFTNHTNSVEAVGSLLYEVKHQIEWDYSYYVSREKSTDGYWKRVSSIEDIPTHAVSTHRTHPVHEPDNLFLFKIYQYLLNHQQQVEEARETGYREGFAKASELAHESHQKQVEEAVLQADATGAYHSGYLAGKAEVEEAVREERSRIYGRLAQMKSVYETMDTGSALVVLLGEDIVREETPNHQD